MSYNKHSWQDGFQLVTTGANITPPAPTSPVTDDTANTFGWTNSAGYALSDHEYSLDGGATYLSATANPQPVGNIAKAIGQVLVRVKAATGRNVSAALANTSAFTASVSSIFIETNESAIHAEPAMPTPPARGAVFTDPVFGTQSLRVTDATDGKFNRPAYSYWSTFNADNTKLLVYSKDTSLNTQTFIIAFDPVNFTIGAKIALPTGVSGGFEDACWSKTDPSKLFYRQNSILYARNIATSTNSVVKDFSTVSGFPSGGRLVQLSMSNGDDVFAFSVYVSSTLWGYCAYKTSTGEIYLNQTTALDEVQIDKSGRFLQVKTGNTNQSGAVKVIVVDLLNWASPVATNLIADSPDYAPGHSDSGIGWTVGNDNFENRLTYRNLATPHTWYKAFDFGPSGGWSIISDFHVSAYGDNQDWVLVTFNGFVSNFPMTCECVLISTDGQERIRRFLKTFNHTTYTESNAYDRTAFGNISKNGKFIAYATGFGDANRNDLYIAKVPDEAYTQG